MNTLELRDKKDALKSQMLAITEKCREEIRMLTDEEKAIYEELKTKIEELNKELQALEDKAKQTSIEEEENTQITDNQRNSKPYMEKRKFSLVNAISNVVNNVRHDEVTQAVMDEARKNLRNSGLSYTGQIQLPVNMEERATVSVTTERGDVVATDIFDIVRPIRERNVLVKAGANYLTGLIGDVQLPQMTGGNVAWADENGTAVDGNVAFTSVKLQPKRLTAVVPISKQLLLQTSQDVENIVREELIKAINAKLEATILGTQAGTANTPAGLFTGTINTSIADFTALCNLEAEVDKYDNLNYIISPKAKAQLRGMTKGAKVTASIFENGEIDGTPAHVTGNVLEKNIVIGDWSKYYIGQWGEIDVTVDSISQADKGIVRLIVNAFFDCKAVDTNAFKVAKLA